ncbi:MAG: prepilin-type N-terminal cleavage/methylation domain-containing protein [Proteobacteria bacterium]|nr:prepilin-type N-terminal cleavage/methylation domain-containing protein [Pseudomonadota bacterium]
MKFKFKGQKGFSLVELMVVVGIMGVLATLSMPKLNLFMAKSKQAEAKSGLSSIYTLQMSYFADNDMYASNIAWIGFSMAENRYTYNVQNGSTTGFNSVATIAAGGLGTGCTDDQWRINATRVLTRVTATPLTCN